MNKLEKLAEKLKDIKVIDDNTNEELACEIQFFHTAVEEYLYGMLDYDKSYQDVITNKWESEFIQELEPWYTESYFGEYFHWIFEELNEAKIDWGRCKNADEIVKLYIIEIVTKTKLHVPKGATKQRKLCEEIDREIEERKKSVLQNL